MLNWIWLGLVLTSVLWAAFSGTMGDVSLALFEGAKAAVGVVVGLVGTMVFMLGITRVAFDGGLREWIARGLRPLLIRLFPDVPPDHPAMSAMVMNMASNMLGLGNAATPFGLKAMVELDKLNRFPGAASDAMVLFLAINTSAITLMPPSGTIATRAAAESADPAAIWLPTLIATTCSTAAAVSVFYLLRHLRRFRHRALADAPPPLSHEDAANSPVPALDGPEPPSASHEAVGAARWLFIAAVVLALGVGLGHEISNLRASDPTTTLAEIVRQVANTWMFPLLIVALLLVGVGGRVRIYDSMIAGAKEGLDVAVRIVPYLVAIMAAVAMLRASGFIEAVVSGIDPVTRSIGVPAEVLPMALLRPLSGSGAFGIMSETLTTHGPDSMIGYMTSTLMGSTETTFYVLALYFGAARITEGRHTLFACLTGDVAGFVGAVAACHLFFG